MKQLSLSALISTVGVLASSAALAQTTSAPIDSSANRALGLRASAVQSLDIQMEDDGSFLIPMLFEGAWTQLSLQPHSVRAAQFELTAQDADGSYRNVDPGRTVTLRGTLEGSPGSMVAGALLEDGFYARIILGDEREFWMQPIAGLVPNATAEDYVLYRRDDVLPTGHTCGADLIANNFGDLGASLSSPTASAGLGLYTCELACDADFEFYQDYGNSMTNVSNRIQTVIATMNLQYESEVDITHEITQILVRTSSNQPYTSTNAGNLLDQFVAQWNSNHGGITRDIAQLFTGKSIQGGTIGIAYLGVICNGSFGYGLVESDFNNNFASATDLSAHELGHNWNADHCSCTSFTMNPFITTSNTFNPSGTRPAITSFRDSRNCLDFGSSGMPPGQTPNPNPANGSGNVSASANLAWGSASGATSYDVYFGTDSTPDGGEFEGNISSTNFSLATLGYSTTYFWRIDAVNSNGTTTGNVWSFTTEADPGAGCTLTDDGLENNDDCGQEVSLTDGLYSGLIVKKTDWDYYALNVAAGDTLSVDLSFTHASGDVDMFLYAPGNCAPFSAGNVNCSGSLDCGFSGSDNESLQYTNTTGAAQALVLKVNIYPPTTTGECNEYDMLIGGTSEGPIGTTYCLANANSSGVPGGISAAGSTTASDNDLSLTAFDLPNNVLGFFIVSPTQVFVPNVGGSSGNLCVGPSIGRGVGGVIFSTGTSGEATVVADLTAMPTPSGPVMIVAGDTLNFQAWHRDSVGGAATSNFTQGLEINFQ